MELSVAIGVGGVLMLGGASMVTHMAATQQSITQRTELGSLMTELKFLFKNPAQCTQNLMSVPGISAMNPAGAPLAKVTQFSFNADGTVRSSSDVVTAGLGFPNPSAGPILINSNTAALPGLSLVYKGTISSSGMTANYSMDLVVNATRNSSGGAGPLGGLVLQDRLPITLVINTTTSTVVQCYIDATTANVTYLESACEVNSEIYDPTTGTCKQPPCFPGSTNMASCPANNTLVTNGCTAVGGIDTLATALKYPQTVVYVGAPAGQPAASAPAFLALPNGTNNGCLCAWAVDATPGGVCEACCVPN